jgi:hypothetical protein
MPSFGAHPGAAGLAPAGRGGDAEFQLALLLGQLRGELEGVGPVGIHVGQALLDQLRRHHLGIEILQAAQARARHPLDVLADALLGDVPVHPVPPHARARAAADRRSRRRAGRSEAVVERHADAAERVLAQAVGEARTGALARQRIDDGVRHADVVQVAAYRLRAPLVVRRAQRQAQRGDRVAAEAAVPSSELQSAPGSCRPGRRPGAARSRPAGPSCSRPRRWPCSSASTAGAGRRRCCRRR